MNNGTNGDGYTVIAQTGVRQNLVTSSLPCNRLDLRALSTNTGDIAVGGNTVSISPVSGIQLHPDEIYNLELITDALNVIIVGNAGDVISYSWWTGDRN